ncbi:extracellular solute-binding protein [Bacillus sp. FJAT-28004]|uniref:extracellular solute-binding protein n=1 Tax=Bacillus sp. FJAT-28004 TaxID=1679165 RepID=UPI0006B658A1|nr:extracellular solute-binding protein [Bacillus sp. FJAT-28004]
MKKMKKPLLMVVSAVFLLVTVLAGCSNSGGKDPKPTTTASNNKEQGSEATETPADAPWVFGSSPLAFSAYTHYGWQDFPDNMDANPFWKYLKENKQVTITPIHAKGNHDALLQTMMADTSQLPDLLYGDRYNPALERLIEGGQMVALDPYLDKYPNLKKWLDPKLMDLLRSADGKLYKFPNWYTEKPTNTGGYVVNKKIYAELGSPALETTDDLYAYLKAVKEKYGDKVVPMDLDRGSEIQGMGVIYTGFGEGNLYKSLSSELQGVIKDDKLVSIFTDPSFRESQKYLAKLYREKLISQDWWTQVRDVVSEKLMTGRVAVYAGSGVTTFASRADMALREKDPNDGYFMIWPVHKAGLDKNKIYAGGWDRLGWNVTSITKHAKDPEKIFAFLDWMTGPEGMTIQFFGPEGGNWKGFDENEQPIFTDTYNEAEVTKIQADNDPVQIVGNTSYIDPAKLKFVNSLPLEKQNWQARWQRDITWPSSNDITAINNLPMSPDSPLGDTRQQILDLSLETFAASTTAKSDEEVDKILDAAEKKAQSYKYEELLAWRTEKWQSNKAILGE